MFDDFDLFPWVKRDLNTGFWSSLEEYMNVKGYNYDDVFDYEHEYDHNDRFDYSEPRPSYSEMREKEYRSDEHHHHHHHHHHHKEFSDFGKTITKVGKNVITVGGAASKVAFVLLSNPIIANKIASGIQKLAWYHAAEEFEKLQSEGNGNDE